MQFSLDSLVEQDKFTFDEKKFNLKLFETFNIQRIDDDDFIRTYKTPNDDEYASVTSMLGIVKNEDFLTRWYDKLARNLEYQDTVIYGKEKRTKKELKKLGKQLGEQIAKASSESGNYMHDTLEQYVLGNTLEYRPNKAFLVNNMIPYLNDNLGDVFLVEGQLWSDQLEVAGTLDLFGRWRGKLAIIDYKNSLKPREDKYNISYYIQSCIYAIMVRERYGIFPEYIVILVSINDPLSTIRVQEFVVKVSDYIPKVVEYIKEYRNSDIYTVLKNITF